MSLRAGEYVALPTALVRLEFGRPAEGGPPRAEVRALLSGPDGGNAAGNAVRHEDGGVRDGVALDTLAVDLASLGSAVNSVRMVVRAQGGSFAELPGMRLRVLTGSAAEPVEVARFDWAGTDSAAEHVLGECYREGGGWHFRAVGRALTAESAGAAGAVTLTAAAPAVSLTPRGAVSGTLLISPEWPAAPDGIGIDLCALFELSDGSKGVVQSLGGAYGSLRRPPFLRLDGGGGEDGYDGQAAGDRGDPAGQRLTVDLGRSAYFRRVLVFAAVSGDPRGFEGLSGTVTLRPEHGADVDFVLDPCAVPSTVCALALLTRDGAELVVRREARYLLPRPGVSPQRTVDYAYGWGLHWTPDRPGRR